MISHRFVRISTRKLRDATGGDQIGGSGTPPMVSGTIAVGLDGTKVAVPLRIASGTVQRTAAPSVCPVTGAQMAPEPALISTNFDFLSPTGYCGR